MLNKKKQLWNWDVLDDDHLKDNEIMTMISDVVPLWSEVYGNLILLSCCLSIIMLHCSQAMSCVTFITFVLNHFTSLQIVFNSITLSCIIVLLILNIIRFIKRCKSYCLINVHWFESFAQNILYIFFNNFKHTCFKSFSIIMH